MDSSIIGIGDESTQGSDSIAEVVVTVFQRNTRRTALQEQFLYSLQCSTWYWRRQQFDLVWIFDRCLRVYWRYKEKSTSDFSFWISSRNSQRLQEYKDEVILTSKLQHLVFRAFGIVILKKKECWSMNTCPTNTWTIFVLFLTRKEVLHWLGKWCFKIIMGVVRGFLFQQYVTWQQYVTRENISNFDMTRAFEKDQTEAKTKQYLYKLQSI